MKILVMSQYPLYASTTNRMLGFALGLAGRGHRVTFLMTGNRYLPGADKKRKLPSRIESVRIRYSLSLPDAFVVMPGFLSGIAAVIAICLFKIPQAVWHALFHNVIYASKPLPYGALVARAASFLTRKPLVLDTDDWEGVGGFATVKQGRRAFVKAVITYFEEKAPLWSRAVVTASRLLAERTILSGAPPEAVFVAPNGADLVTFNPDINGRRIRQHYNLSGTVFCYVGTFKGGGANWRMLLDAFKHASGARAGMMLLVIGFGDQLEDARAHAVKTGIAPQVVFAGKVDHAQVPEHIAAADVCLLPYQDDFPNTFINIGRSSVKLYEYMAMGRAVVGTDVGEVREALKDNAGVLVKSNDPAEFGRAMVSLLEVPGRITALGANARALAESRYNYPVMSGVVEKALKYALRG
jgi:glycosyltransferase involved in cell wall biosynthesis